MNYDTDTIDRLFLELSQFTKAKTGRELALEARVKEMEELLRSAHCIALRKGENTAWQRLAYSIGRLGIGGITARTYQVLPGDLEEPNEQPPTP